MLHLTRRLIAKRILAAFVEEFSGISTARFPVNAANTAGGPNASIYFDSPSGGSIILEIEPKGGSRALPGSDWGIKILAAVWEGSSLLSHETERLAFRIIPSFSLDTLQAHLSGRGLATLASRLYSVKMPTGTKTAYESEPGVASEAERWHGRFTENKKASKGPNHPIFYGYVDGGLGSQFYIENSVTADELRTLALALAHLVSHSARE